MVTTNSTSDKLAALSKEAESLKAKLEEERHKLNDISCECFHLFIIVNLNLCKVLVENQ